MATQRASRLCRGLTHTDTYAHMQASNPVPQRGELLPVQPSAVAGDPGARTRPHARPACCLR